MGHTQVCTSLQTDNHASTPPLSGQNNEIPTPLINANCNLNKSCITTYSVQILDNNAKVAGSHSKIHIIFHEYSLTFPSTYFNSIYVSIYAYLVSITLPAVAHQRQKHISLITVKFADFTFSRFVAAMNKKKTKCITQGLSDHPSPRHK